MNEQSAEKDAAAEARADAAAAAVRLAYAWDEFWQAVKRLGEATRPIPPEPSEPK